MGPFSSNKSASSTLPKSPKSTKSSSGRSRFSKALPAPPPVFDKLFSSSSSSAAAADRSAAAVDFTPSLPPLPPPSSNLLDSTSYSFIPSANPLPPSARQNPNAHSIRRRPVAGSHGSALPDAHPFSPTSSTSLSPTSSRPPVDFAGSAASSATPPAYASSAVAPAAEASEKPQPKGSSRPQLPEFPKSSDSLFDLPELPAFPTLLSSVTPALSSSSSSDFQLSSSQPTTLPSVQPALLPIRQPPAEPASPSHQQHLLSKQVTAVSAPSAAVISASATNTTPAAVATVAAASAPPPSDSSPPARKHSSGAASISSILSAYSQPTVPEGISPSASNNTNSTNSTNSPNNSSYTTAVTPPQPSTSSSVSSLSVSSTRAPAKSGPTSDAAHSASDEGLTPLSYLLEEEYGEEEGELDTEVTGEELYQHHGQSNPQHHEHASLDATNNVSSAPAVSPPRLISRDEHSRGVAAGAAVVASRGENTQSPQSLPPRSTSLGSPPSAAPKTHATSDDVSRNNNTSDIIISNDGIKNNAFHIINDSTPSSQSSQNSQNLPPPLPVKDLPAEPLGRERAPSTSSQLLQRRAERLDGGLAVPQLDLTLSSTPPGTTKQVPLPQKDLPTQPLDNTPASQPASQLPLSPLPLPPSRTALDQLQPPRRSPQATSSPRSAYSSVAASPRIGLPNRDIRPSRQQSPAVILALSPARPAPSESRDNSSSTPASSAAAAISPNMGQNISNFESKIETKLKRKESKSVKNSIATSSSSSPSPSPVAPPAPAPPAALSAPPPIRNTTLPSSPRPQNTQNTQNTQNIQHTPRLPGSSPRPQQPTTTTPKLPSLPQTPSFQRPPTPEYDDEEEHKNGAATNGNATPSFVTSPAMAASVAAAAAAAAAANATAPVSPASSPTTSASSPGVGPMSPPTSQDTALPPRIPGFAGRDIRPMKSNVSMSGQEQQLRTQQLQQQPQQTQQTQPAPTPFTLPQKQPVPSAAAYDPYRYSSEETSASEAGSQVTIKAMQPSQQQPQYLPYQQESLAQQPPFPSHVHRQSHSSNAADEELELAPGMPPLFPTGYMEPLAPDAVFEAPPPSRVHFNCIQQHRDMFRDLNVHYPLSCQTCQTFERSVRWRCKWCYLRVCTACRDSLHSEATGGDVGLLMDQLNGHDSRPIKSMVGA